MTRNNSVLQRLPVPVAHEALIDLARRWKITEIALFGSVLSNAFRDDSDIDVLVSFEPNSDWSLFDLIDLQDELTRLFGRPVDLVERQAIEKSRNYIQRKAILDSTQVIYTA